jgi:hypothetical protein
MTSIPEFALSIQQPWAWLIVNGHKSIENRDWKPWNPGLKFRGPVAIHAGKQFDRGALNDVRRGNHPVTGMSGHDFGDPSDTYEMMLAGRHCGGIVGVAEIVDVVDDSSDHWFVGKYGIVLKNAAPVPMIPVKGALGFFKWRESLEA